MDDLIAWLRAQLDDDEAAADAILYPPPRHYDKGWQADELRKFATRQLAEIDAKRRILDRLAEWLNVDDEYDEVQTTLLAEGEHMARALAQPYADRPGYLEEWRPE